MSNVVVVIPAYQPDGELTKLVRALREQALNVLIVNDGSDPKCAALFEETEELGARVLHSPKNEGKGAALKRGFTALTEQFPDCTHFITADADGQHCPADILKVKAALEEGAKFVLTVRRLKGNIPIRSKLGNGASRIVYTIMTGHYFDDNQSGLRGFAIDQLEWLLLVGGRKYDYELNMLCFADKQGIHITTVPIEPIYFNNNRASHFNAVTDTFRLYRRLFATTWPSLVGVGIWAVLSVLAIFTLGYRFLYVSIPSAVMLGACFSVALSGSVVFHKVRYRDGLRCLFFSLLRSGFYCAVFRTFELLLPKAPMLIPLIVGAVLGMIFEYYLHKGMHRIFHK